MTQHAGLAVAGLVVRGRYARSSKHSGLVLAAALTAFAVATVCVAALPRFVSGAPQWPTALAAILALGLGAVLLPTVAFVPEHEVRGPALARRGWLTGCGLALVAGAGDVLQLAFFMCLLAGGAAEIRQAQRALRAEAVAKERRRIARDLHDGTAQDLAFILHVARRLTQREGAPPELQQLETAARQALDYTRHALTGLVRPSGEPLMSALRRTAQDIAEREGARAYVEGDLDVSVPPVTQNGLCLLVREAVTNAVRHGGARTVRVNVQDAPKLRLSIGDDGRGFDPEQARASAEGFGLCGMDHRVGELGGELQISSQPGKGTEVLVVLPSTSSGPRPDHWNGDKRGLRREGVGLDQVGQREVRIAPERSLEGPAHQVVAPRGLGVSPHPEHQRDEVALSVEVEGLHVRDAL
jgi:signal transduction histidine kinase